MRLVETQPAEVVTLVAEVRALMVGSRQITRSVFRQLDVVDYEVCEPMGRVNGETSADSYGGVGLWIVGRDKHTGELVRADYKLKQREPYWTQLDDKDLKDSREKAKQARDYATHPWIDSNRKWEEKWIKHQHDTSRWAEAHTKHMSLPLIVLAGLK